MKKDKYAQALKYIDKARKILLVTHVNPDGDAFSSICAMIDILKRKNKDFDAYTRDEVPIQFFFLPHIENLVHDISRLDFGRYDLIISLDCGQVARTGIAEAINGRHKHQIFMELDHHPKMEEASDLEIRIPEMSSTSEIIYELAKAGGIRFTKDLANCILTGIMTDTGNFMYPSTSEKTMSIASEMLLYGAKYPRVLQNTWQNKSFDSMKLWGEALGNLQVNTRYNFAFSVISHELFRESAATEEELDGISGFLGNIYGVAGVLFLREEKLGQLRGSLRSNSSLDVAKLAQALGGGGHPKAAGFTIPGHIEKTAEGWRVV